MTADLPTPEGSKRRTLRLPGYKFAKVLGRGAQGVVVKGLREADDLFVAIKVLSDADVEGYRARFKREAQVLLGIEHPNVVGAIDMGTVDDTPYIVMEYVEGETLADRIRTDWLEPDDALSIVRQASEGLAVIHEHRLVHRDIKPENLMITTEGVVKLMDLGLAKALDSGDDLTVTGSVFGTPGFMSPEAARDTKDTDIRSDIYSLGCSLYQALTRRLPFYEKSIGKMLRKLLTEPPPPPSKHRPDLPPHVTALVMKMIARDREQRAQDPAELLVDIDRALEGKPPRAARPGKAKKGRGWWPFGKN